MFILIKCRYVIDPNSTIVELMLNHTRTFEKLEAFGRYRTRRTDTARVAPNTPRAGAASGLHRPLGYLGQLKRYLSSSFYIVKISLGQGPRVILLKYHSSPQIPLGFASGDLGWLVVFQAKYYSFLKRSRAISHKIYLREAFKIKKWSNLGKSPNLSLIG